MKEIISPVLYLGFCAALFLDAGAQKSCEYEFHVKPGHHLSMGLSNLTKASGKRHKFCTTIIRADVGTRIVLDLVYVPKKRRKSTTASSTPCTSDYVHVGNDVRRVDVQLMTSYKFCDESANYELVSRDNEMWFVYKASTSKPRDLVVKIQAKEPVVCRPDEFTCSPVQCVSKTLICDGVKDCNNGHDEYCMTTGSSNDAMPCFRCLDGTCIAPRLHRYDTGWGRVLWYLCDGFPHCADGWDERPDICSQLLKGRVGSVTQCVPFDQKYGPKRKVVMWNDVRCDDVTDCYHAEDEVRCRRDGQDGPKIHAEPLTIGIIAGIVVIASAIGISICRFQNRGRRGVRPSMESAVETLCTQCASCDGDQSEAHQHRSASCCSETVSAIDLPDAAKSGACCHGNGIEKGAKSGFCNLDDCGNKG